MLSSRLAAHLDTQSGLMNGPYDMDDQVIKVLLGVCVSGLTGCLRRRRPNNVALVPSTMDAPERAARPNNACKVTSTNARTLIHASHVLV